MSNKNTELLLQWASLWSSGNVESFLGLFAEDCYYEDVAFSMVSKGKEQLRNFFASTRTALPDLKMNVQSCFASEKNGAVEWIMQGTHREAFHDVPATNQMIEVRGVTFIDLENGKIKTNKDYYNLVTVLKQIGMFLEP
ncbi:nuclear transport factor 2 family protein [Leptolyngbya sp. FACHB-261]|uniref:nuclear transport factor 2 family protein n=1 Tax=Leptolyngbya sp. FACHB-261 TaxID=2692806 RepID=UPI001688175B|nr:nuclear transport factor 2 family protein [Leptolyngbya sp. FACHB-261]MBD2099570.1 ester cyclase [Leptolyngbya sp. FACHB-261]